MDPTTQLSKMGDYRQVRSSSPSNQHRDSDELELREHVVQEKAPDPGDEQHERLLSEDDDEKFRDDHDDNQPRKRRRRWWRLGLFGLVGLLILTAVAVALNYFYLQETGGEAVSAFRRPSSDYIIDSAWDYDAPPTVREYHWTISDITANPDGVFRPMMVINGQFPGPMIVCNEGDTVVVNVVNESKNSTAIHWHGLFQNGTNWNDGTVGVTQCPIAPGRSYRYEFIVKGQAGSCKLTGPHALALFTEYFYSFLSRASSCPKLRWPGWPPDHPFQGGEGQSTDCIRLGPCDYGAGLVP